VKKLLLVLAMSVICSTVWAETYTVEEVTDCSTIKLTSGEEVKLIGIQCPEDEKMGQEATEFVKNFALEGKEVRLEFDVQERDKHGRLLAYIYILVCIDCDLKKDKRFEYTHFEDQGKYGAEYLFLNASIIKSGYAQPMTIPPNVKYAELFEELYKEAKEQGRGLWKEKLLGD